MVLKCGIVGLPNVGKSTLFNALTKASVPAENFPFCTIEPHIGTIELPDERLEKLIEIYKPDKVTPATIEFIDIAGLVSGASKGEGLGNRFLAQIREVSAIIHVVRCFNDRNITHIKNEVNAIRDAKLIETELLLADIETIQNRYYKIDKIAKSGDKKVKKTLDTITRLLKHCNKGHRARTFKHSQEEYNDIYSLHLLTAKPILYVANIDDKQSINENPIHVEKKFLEFALKKNNMVIPLCVKLEKEIADLPIEEKEIFLKEYNLKEAGLKKLIQSSFKLLDLSTFFTGGPNEVRSWTIKNGTTAPEAAGEIHSDFQRGFIKAEVIKYNDLVELGSEKAVKDRGLSKLEGRDYKVKNGDCIYFHFNV